MTLFRKLVLSLYLLMAFPLGVCELVTGQENTEIPARDIDPFVDIDASATHPDSEKEKLRFFGTQVWGEEFTKLIKQEIPGVEDWSKEFTVQEPPANTSLRTEKELEYLMKLKALRTPEKLKQIDEECSPEGIVLADFAFSKIPEEYPKLKELIMYTYWRTEPLVMKFKFRFNRVRPSFLLPDIEPTIEIPNHAAYPSAHSTACFTYAYAISDAVPGKRDELLSSAQTIAQNREIAGVHYPSDSRAGKELAIQIHQHLTKDPVYLQMVEEARAEYTTANGESAN